MKLNHDCVRDILLTIEDTDFNQKISLATFSESDRTSNYPDESISYATKLLIQAGYIDGKLFPMPRKDDYLINGLTWEGHHFLDNIRDDGIWKETKNTTSGIASVSLPIIYDVASSLIKKSLGLD